jgi:hypothetical protein
MPQQTLRALVVTHPSQLEKLPLGGQLPPVAHRPWRCVEVTPPDGEAGAGPDAGPDVEAGPWLLLYPEDQSIPRDLGLPVERVEVEDGAFVIRGQRLATGRAWSGWCLAAALPLQAAPVSRQLKAPTQALLGLERAHELADAVHQCLSLGVSGLHVASLRADDPHRDALGRLLLRIDRPSLFLLERWHAESKTLYLSAGAPSLWVRLGWQHPWAAWLSKPGFISASASTGRRARDPNPSQWLLDPPAAWQPLPDQPFRDVFDAATLSLAATDATLPAQAPIAFHISIRWGARAQHGNAEVWLLTSDLLPRLEHLLGVLSDADLNNLQLAVVTDPDGDTWFVVREVISGRSRHFLDFGEGFGSYAGFSNLLLPIDRTLEPPVRRDLISQAFKLTPGELTMVRAVSGSKMQVLRLSERLFRPLNSLIDYLVQGAQRTLQAALGRSIFDLTELADLPARPAWQPPAHSEPAPRRRRARGGADDADISDADDADISDVDGEADDGGAAAASQRSARSRRGALAAQAATEGDEVLALADTPPPPSPDEEDAFERAAIEALSSPPPWVALAQDKASRRHLPLAIACLEHALWLSDGDARSAQRLWKTLRAWTDPKASNTRDLSVELRHQVLTFCAAFSAQQLSPDQVIARLPPLIEALRERGRSLSKKARWLLWHRLLTLTGDTVELAHQREQLLGELAMRGVEDRDSFPFVRRHVRLQQRATDRLPLTITWLSSLKAHIDRISDVSLKLELFGQVAMSLEVAGDPAAARDAVHDLSKSLRALPAGKGALPFASAAAAAARLGMAETEPLFLEAFRHFGAMPEGYDKDLTLSPLLDAVQHASLLSAEETLMTRLFDLIAAQSPRRQCLQLLDCVDHLIELGSSAAAAAFALRLIQAPDVRADFYYLEHALRALVLCQSGRPPDEPLARDLLSLMLAPTARLDPSGARVIDLALSALDDAAADSILRAAQSRDPFSALLLRSCVARTQALRGQHDEGSRRLAALLTDAWQLNDPSQRHDALLHLIPILAHFGRPDAAAAAVSLILERLNPSPSNPSLSPRDHGDLLLCCARTLSKLGDLDRAFSLLDATITAFERFLSSSPARDPAAGGGHSALFEVLVSVADEVLSTGDLTRGAALIDRGVTAVQTWLAQPRPASSTPSTDHPFFVHQARLRCAIAMLSLDQRDRGLALLDQSLKAISSVRAFDGKDRADLLIYALQALSLTNLDEPSRLAILDQLLSTGIGLEPPNPYNDAFRRDLIRASVREVIQRHTAYRLALKKIRASEERIIRSRITAP